MRKATPFRIRLHARLKAAGIAGMTKTEIGKYAQTDRDKIDLALAELLGARSIVERKDTSGDGRPRLCYWHKDFAPKLTLGLPPVIDIHTGTASRGSGVCHQCGGPTLTVLGRPQMYCSDSCRALAKGHGLTTKLLLDQATDPAVFCDVCKLLVLIDLRLRGFFFALDPLAPSSGKILVYDKSDAALPLLVLAVAAVGPNPDPETFGCDSIALVYNDGRVRYTGKIPLIVEPVAETRDGIPWDNEDVAFNYAGEKAEESGSAPRAVLECADSGEVRDCQEFLAERCARNTDVARANGRDEIK